MRGCYTLALPGLSALVCQIGLGCGRGGGGFGGAARRRVWEVLDLGVWGGAGWRGVADAGAWPLGRAGCQFASGLWDGSPRARPSSVASQTGRAREEAVWEFGCCRWRVLWAFAFGLPFRALWLWCPVALARCVGLFGMLSPWATSCAGRAWGRGGFMNLFGSFAKGCVLYLFSFSDVV